MSAETPDEGSGRVNAIRSRVDNGALSRGETGRSRWSKETTQFM
jgi:hypothetical protein